MSADITECICFTLGDLEAKKSTITKWKLFCETPLIYLTYSRLVYCTCLCIYWLFSHQPSIYIQVKYPRPIIGNCHTNTCREKPVNCFREAAKNFKMGWNDPGIARSRRLGTRSCSSPQWGAK